LEVSDHAIQYRKLSLFPRLLERSTQQELTKLMIYVLIWFDVEDYFSPESDDADMRAAELASRAGVPVTMKIVGEKARSLERNDRQDVIQALARHAIGYHSDWHSRPPTIAAYLSDLSWENGVNEFEQRERQGFEDLSRIFGQNPICFGQPGMSWAPQIYPALKKWGIPLYLDEAGHVGLPDEQPFWFQGMLHVFNLRRNAIKMEFGSAADFQQTCALFQSAHERLSSGGGGLVSLYYHPQEFIYREFRDVVNFGGGANPTPRHWRTCERRTPAEVRAGHHSYARLLSFIRSFDHTCFIDARQVSNLYREPALAENLPLQLISELAHKVQSEITFHQVRDHFFSAAEAFSVLVRWLLMHLGLTAEGVASASRSVLGPTQESRPIQPIQQAIRWSDFQSAVQCTAHFLDEHAEIPPAIRVGDHISSPEDFLANLGRVVLCLTKDLPPPSSLSWQAGNFTAAQYAAEDSPELWAWPIFPRGFRAPNLMRLARLQTWTIKPAKLQHEMETVSRKA
jgi:hypothetical protein